ncbi:MAG: hypothetical protein Q9183_002784 [Haloplaca sp. 2 TL-2023]
MLNAVNHRYLRDLSEIASASAQAFGPQGLNGRGGRGGDNIVLTRNDGLDLVVLDSLLDLLSLVYAVIMRGIQVQEYVQGPQDLTVTTLPDLKPSPDTYLIAIHASATNFFDLLQIRGKYQHQPALPFMAGAEFAGVILSTPSSTKAPKFKRGDRVFGSSQGGYATQVCAKEESLMPIPPGWGFMEAAGLMVTAPTAYAALALEARVRKGEYVLVHAAAGGVGP